MTGVVQHAERAYIYQPLYAMFQARLDYIARSPDRSLLKLGRAAFHGRADVIDQFNTLHGVVNHFGLPQASVHDRYFPARDSPDRQECPASAAAAAAAGSALPAPAAFPPAHYPEILRLL